MYVHSLSIKSISVGQKSPNCLTLILTIQNKGSVLQRAARAPVEPHTPSAFSVFTRPFSETVLQLLSRAAFPTMLLCFLHFHLHPLPPSRGLLESSSSARVFVCACACAGCLHTARLRWGGTKKGGGRAVIGRESTSITTK